MGIVRFGIPLEEAILLKNLLKLNCFVETGTYMGETAKKMANVFSKVYTIEKSEVFFQKASKNLSNFPNVNLICGDSREVLKEIFEKEDDILFWLDAHWSGGETYGENDECPLIDELNIIFQKKQKLLFVKR
ncbi:MAG: hypothetical protein ACP5IB_07170 [Thermoplasmata archaeon]